MSAAPIASALAGSIISARFSICPSFIFFDDMPAETMGGAAGMGKQIQQRFELDPLVKRETLKLVRAYYRITDACVRKRLFEMVKPLATMPPTNNK